MTNLFDTKDLLTVATVDQAEVGTKGYFGDNLSNLIEKVRQSKVETLTDVIPDVTYCFESNNDLHYVFFLPADRVKNKVKEPAYRPIKTIDELFNFLVPGLDTDCDILEKVKLILSRIYELRGKQTGYLYYRTFTRIYLTDKDIRIDDSSLNYIFENYEIKINDEFVPFGIKEE